MGEISFNPTLAKQLARGTKSDVLNRAYRIRCGIQAECLCCLCGWPLVKHATSSEHEERCPAHAIRRSMLEAEARR